MAMTDGILQRVNRFCRDGKVSPARLSKAIGWRLNHLRPLAQSFRTWRGESPRVYVHNEHVHPCFSTYRTHPPLVSTPYPFAGLSHWVNFLPSARLRRKPHVLEFEHPLLFLSDHRHFMRDYHRIYEQRELLEEILGNDACKKAITFSAGLVEHTKEFIDPALWPKLDFAHLAFPSQPEYVAPERPFNILSIASRFSDKGIPEALAAFEILRARHGKAVRMTLVTNAVPSGTRMPDGAEVLITPRMSDDVKRAIYEDADVLLLPCYSETAACFTEATAFGVPIVTTRIHHGDAFVREGETGFLLDAPLYTYSSSFGTRWKTAEAFLADLDDTRERGGLQVVVDQTVDRLEEMIAGRFDITQMRVASRALHAERFSPEARNRTLRRIYDEAMGVVR